MAKTKLFCIPYAGGSAVIFNRWKQYADAEIELSPVELAGHGSRIQENLYDNLPEAVDDVFRIVRSQVNGQPYALFGHSLGAKICYQLAQKISNSDFREPVHIFFSGKSAPHVIRQDEKKYHLMNDEEFKREIINLGGTPPELFEHPELLDVFIPVLKNDFRLAEADAKEQTIHPLNTDITVFLGKAEEFNAAQCDGWKKHTTKNCSIHYFNGAHFFLHEEAKNIVQLINATIKRARAQAVSNFRESWPT